MADAHDERPSEEALFRFHVLGAIRAHIAGGGRAGEAIARLAGQVHRDLRGAARRLSVRTLWRWLAAFAGNGLAGLEPDPRPKVADSRTLPRELLAFCRLEKGLDPEASVPELLARARTRGVIPSDLQIDRTSLWRALVRMGIPISRPRRLAQRDMRRYAFPHRMLLVLADGKHFRAGLQRLKRVALCFLDDATRFGLHVLVGTAESAHLFLRGLHDAIRDHGLMSLLYLDQGPGFIAGDTFAACARLGVPLIHGEKAYPEAHGKIERFNRTFFHRVLRSLDGHPAVDPDCTALTLRLNHALDEVYNHTPHEGIGGETPFARWQRDERPLEPVPDAEWLRDRFRLSFSRRVSKDNVVPYRRVFYELPRGSAGDRVTLVRSLLEPDALFLPQEGRLVRLHPVDLRANAYARRQPIAPGPPSAPEGPPRETAAHQFFDQTFSPLVDPDGGFAQLTDERTIDHDQEDPEPEP